MVAVIKTSYSIQKWNFIRAELSKDFGKNSYYPIVTIKGRDFNFKTNFKACFNSKMEAKQKVIGLGY